MTSELVGRSGPVARPDKRVVTQGAFPVGTGRRCLDVVVASLLLLAAAPVLVVAAALVLLADGRPVFYRQQRIGQGGRSFSLVKLRSMSVQDGAGVTAVGDPRITRVGAVLRRTSLDELPQLWHVLRGQMTLVGPRPESEALARRYPESCRAVLTARPGLTGPAQLRYRERSALPPPGWDDVEQWYLRVLVPLRVQADLDYLQRPTLRATLRYVRLTALFVIGVVDLQAPAASPTTPLSTEPTAQPTPEG